MPRVADFIENNRERLVERYRAEVSKLESAAGVSESELIDTFPEYLLTLATISREGKRSAPEKTKRRMEETHISLRLRLGYTQEEVTSEYVVMGRLISSLWEDLPVEEHPPSEDTQLLFEELQAAMEQTVATFSGYTLEDRQREQRALRRLDSLSATVIGDVEHPVPLQERLAALVEVVQGAMNADGAALLLADSDRRLLLPTISTGRWRTLEEREPIPVDGASFVGQLAASEETLSLPDASTSPGISQGVRQSGVRSLLGLRLWPHGKLLGVLYLGVTEIRPFEPQARRRFETLVEYLSGIIQKALLLQQLRLSNQQLRASEDRLRLTLRAAELGAWDFNPATGSLLWDERCKALFGLPPDAVVDYDTFLAGLHPEDRERVHAVVQHSLAGENGGDYDIEYRTVGLRDGVERWVRAIGRTFFEGDRPMRFIGTLLDISDRKRLEAEAVQRAKFTEQLIGIVSHDLRSPLTAITLATATVLHSAPLEERQAKGLGRISSAAERANRMIHDLLDFTRARLGGGIPVQPGPLDLHVLTQQTVDEIRLAHPERELQVASHGPGKGEWDGDRLAQVITNLVNNALAYSPAGTPVRVETRGEEEAVTLRVHNQGAPIPPELLPRLFEPMTRGEQNGSSASRSIGLGLYIVNHIVRAHGGRVSVHSTASEGTTFTVRLPRRAPTP